ncbi:MAG: DUF4367 domain-containing protein, partial [Clostridia bacterium]|nr:DUF4367 domain-containing protein [Clostridia bacterium]
ALPEYLPTGWSIEVYEEDQASRIYQIHGTNGEQVIYEQTVAGGTDVWFDNTDCTVKEIRLKTGCEGYILLYPDDSVSLIWSDTYLYTLVGYNTAESILIEIANSIG